MEKSTERKKESKTRQNFALMVYDSIKRDNKLPNLDMPRQNRDYYLNLLKKALIVKKVGYGTWEILSEFNERKLKKQGKTRQNLTTLVDDHNLDTWSNNLHTSLRAHAFQFTLKIQKNMGNWLKREDFLKKYNITYKPSLIGQKLFLDGRNIWLTNKSIVINENKNYIVQAAKEGKNYAIDDMISIVRKLEKLLKCSFKIGKKYIFKVTRQHYAKLHDNLAKQYRRDGNKLYVNDHKGFWMWIDYSMAIDELETGNREDSDKHMDDKVIPFFNSLKANNNVIEFIKELEKEEMNGFKPSFIVNGFAELIKDRAYFAENMRLHVGAIQTLGEQTEKLVNEVTNVVKVVKETSQKLTK